MNDDELRLVDGGLIPVWLLRTIIVAAISNLDEFYDGVVEGMNSYESQI